MSDKVIPLHRKRPCPVCRKSSVAEHAPFCSQRCREVDLNRWLSEGYRIETNEAPLNDEDAPED